MCFCRPLPYTTATKFNYTSVDSLLALKSSRIKRKRIIIKGVYYKKKKLLSLVESSGWKIISKLRQRIYRWACVYIYIYRYVHSQQERESQKCEKFSTLKELFCAVIKRDGNPVNFSSARYFLSLSVCECI